MYKGNSMSDTDGNWYRVLGYGNDGEIHVQSPDHYEMTLCGAPRELAFTGDVGEILGASRCMICDDLASGIESFNTSSERQLNE
jgi:hypothetical protein